MSRPPWGGEPTDDDGRTRDVRALRALAQRNRAVAAYALLQGMPDLSALLMEWANDYEHRAAMALRWLARVGAVPGGNVPASQTQAPEGRATGPGPVSDRHSTRPPALGHDGHAVGPPDTPHEPPVPDRKRMAGGDS